MKKEEKLTLKNLVFMYLLLNALNQQLINSFFGEQKAIKIRFNSREKLSFY